MRGHRGIRNSWGFVAEKMIEVSNQASHDYASGWIAAGHRLFAHEHLGGFGRTGDVAELAPMAGE